MYRRIRSRNLASWKRRSILLSTALVATLVAVGAAAAEGLTANQQLAHDIYKELVEIDTTTATGDTDRAAQALAARLKAAGFTDDDVHAFSPAPRRHTSASTRSSVSSGENVALGPPTRIAAPGSVSRTARAIDRVRPRFDS